MSNRIPDSYLLFIECMITALLLSAHLLGLCKLINIENRLRQGMSGKLHYLVETEDRSHQRSAMIIQKDE